MTNSKSFQRTVVAAVLIAALSAPTQAGVLGKFKELLVNTGTAMTNYNENMWGDSGLGAAAIKGVKGTVKGEMKWDAAFDSVVAAQAKTQASAHADVKAVLKTLADIVLWLPRKLQELFKKAMDKVRAFIAKLDSMNQGATIKDRFGSLVGGAPAGGGAAMMGGDLGGDDVGGFDAALDDAASVDAPSAPRASESLPDLDGAFTAMLSTVGTGLEGDQRKAGVVGVRKSFLKCVELTFLRDSEAGAKMLFQEAPSVFRGNPAGMQKAVEALAQKSGTKLSQSFAKGTSRLAKSIQVQSR